MMSSDRIIPLVILLGLVLGIGFWKVDFLKAAFKYIAKDEMPIWLSIALAISAGVGTYYIAPLVNENFEFQKNRSTHLISTIEELNKGVVELAVAVRKFDDSLFNKGNKADRRGDALDKIAELQWRLVAADVIIKRVYPNDKSTRNLSTALGRLQNAVIEARKPEDQEVVADAYVNAVKSAQKCMIVLYEAAKIN